jgi:hypothetical protein
VFLTEKLAKTTEMPTVNLAPIDPLRPIAQALALRVQETVSPLMAGSRARSRACPGCPGYRGPAGSFVPQLNYTADGVAVG